MQPPDRTDSTDVGGRTLLSFSDRTQIELDTNTSMRIRMTTAERTVWLEKGEAWFHVAHDAAHPFTVVVGKHRITDLGTEFLVRRDENNVDVALVNGRAALNASGQQTATLNPGDEAIATPVSLSVTRKTPQQLADELSWRHGMLVFRDAPLSEVVREFNRYNQTKLVIADPSIAGKRIYASLRTDDFDGFVQLAEMELNLRVDRVGRTIVLSRGQQQATKRIVRLKHNP
jgi:transmembrane sensor